jgi:hypothetical protein
VNSKTGLNFSVPSLESRAQTYHDYKHHHVAGEVANVPFADFKPDDTPVSTDFYAGESGREAASFVQRLYKFDFEAYGYSMEVPLKMVAEPNEAERYDKLRDDFYELYHN